MVVKVSTYSKAFKEDAVERARIIGVKPAARELSIPATTLARWGKQAHPPLADKQPHDREFKDATIEMLRQGHTYREVAAQQHLSFKTISKWVKEFNNNSNTPIEKNKKGYSQEFKTRVLGRARLVGGVAAAREFKVDPTIVYDWGRKADPPLDVKKPYDSSFRQASVDLILQGLSYKQVASKQRISVTALSRWVKAFRDGKHVVMEEENHPELPKWKDNQTPEQYYQMLSRIQKLNWLHHSLIGWARNEMRLVALEEQLSREKHTEILCSIPLFDLRILDLLQCLIAENTRLFSCQSDAQQQLHEQLLSLNRAFSEYLEDLEDDELANVFHVTEAETRAIVSQMLLTSDTLFEVENGEAS